MGRARAWVLGVVAWSAAGGGCRQAVPGGGAMSHEAPITAKVVDVSYMKPPLAELFLDVVLRNGEGAARWFVLPSALPRRGEGGVNVLEAQAFEGRGRAVVGRFLGTGGCYALLLPAGAEVRLQRLPIEYWGDPPARLRLDLRIATDLAVGGEPARTWFESDPTSDARVD